MKTNPFITRRSRLFRNQNLLKYLFLSIIGIPAIFPFWWMVISGFKREIEVLAYPPTLIPIEWHWINFINVFKFQPFAREYGNSIYISCLVTIGTLIVSSLAGYSFSRIRFRGSSVIFLILLGGLMLPTEVTLLPNFMFMKSLNLYNTHIPLIILPIFGSQGILATFMMRQFFLSLPSEIEDAARVDGLSRFGVYWKIALPLAKSPIAAVSILTFLTSWNSFLEPLIYLESRNLYTLPLAIRSFIDDSGNHIWNLQLAATTLSVLPVLLLFIFAQKQVVESFLYSGTKG